MVGILYLVVGIWYLIVGAKTAVAKYSLEGAKLPTAAQRGEKASLHIAWTKQCRKMHQNRTNLILISKNILPCPAVILLCLRKTNGNQSLKKVR